MFGQKAAVEVAGRFARGNNVSSLVLDGGTLGASQDPIRPRFFLFSGVEVKGTHHHHHHAAAVVVVGRTQFGNIFSGGKVFFTPF